MGEQARVLVVADYAGGDGPATGGAGLAVLASYRALRTHGIDAHLLVGFGDGCNEERDRTTQLGGADLRDAGTSGALRSIYNVAAGKALEASLAQYDPHHTVVILHQWTRFLSPAGLARLRRYRMMVYMHDYFWACPNGAYFDYQAGTPCTRRPMGLACLAADCDKQGRVTKAGRIARHQALSFATLGARNRRVLLSLSNGAQRVVENLLPAERHAVIHNAMVLPQEPPPHVSAAAYDFGYFGRLEVEKGVLDLVQQARSLSRSVLLVGDGPLAAQLADMPGVSVRQWQPRSGTLQTMRSCRAIVLPSRWHETWGLIVPEAMAAGVPVLVSRRAGSAELVNQFGGGLVFDPRLAGDLKRKLIAVLERGGALSISPASWQSLRTLLSPAAHAARIVTIAARAWGVSLGNAPYAPRVPPPASALREGAVLPLAT